MYAFRLGAIELHVHCHEKGFSNYCQTFKFLPGKCKLVQWQVVSFANINRVTSRVSRRGHFFVVMQNMEVFVNIHTNFHHKKHVSL